MSVQNGESAAAIACYAVILYDLSRVPRSTT